MLTDPSQVQTHLLFYILGFQFFHSRKRQILNIKNWISKYSGSNQLLGVRQKHKLAEDYWKWSVEKPTSSRLNKKQQINIFYEMLAVHFLWSLAWRIYIVL